MKTFWKTEDRAIDNLLRSRLSEESATESFCQEFDPNLANAYIERCLTPAQQAGYERHISLCSPCRKTTVALARMAQAETGVSITSLTPASGDSPAGWLQSLKGFFIGLARPQVALAAVAVIALAVSIPLVRSGKDSAPSQMASASQPDTRELAKADPNSPPAPEAVPAPPTLMVDQRTKERAAVYDGAAGPAATRDENRQQAAQQPAGEAAGAVAVADAQNEVQKNEVKSEAAAAETERRVAQETAREGDDAPKPAAPAAQPEEQKPLAKINPEEALRLKKDKDSVSMTPLKPGRPNGDRAKDPTATIRPEDVVAPPSDTSSDETARRGRIASDRSGRAFRDREAEPRATAPRRGTPERKIVGKRFYLLNDVWTDKDYKPGKEMPEVTIVRDSDLYKEVLAKRSGLKTYLTRFDEKERAIIVYKDTVYKLEPSQK